MLTQDQAEALLDRFMETHPLIPAQGTEARSQWFVDLVRMVYQEGVEAGRMLPLRRGYSDPREQHLEDIKNR